MVRSAGRLERVRLVDYISVDRLLCGLDFLRNELYRKGVSGIIYEVQCAQLASRWSVRNDVVKLSELGAPFGVLLEGGCDSLTVEKLDSISPDNRLETMSALMNLAKKSQRN